MTSSRRLTVRVLALGTIVAFVLAGCGGDDDSSDKKSTTTTEKTTTTKAADGKDGTTTTAATDDPITAAIEQRLASQGVDHVNNDEAEGPILVMKSGATLAQVSRACTLAKQIAPKGTTVRVERDGSVDPCP